MHVKSGSAGEATLGYGEWRDVPRAPLEATDVTVDEGMTECLECASAGRTVTGGTTDGTYNCRDRSQNSILYARVVNRSCSPFCHRIEGLFRRICNDRHLVASNRIDQPTAFYDRLRANEDNVDLVHDIRHGRVQDNRARNPGLCKSRVRLDSIKTCVC
jgi:hypothetical protein